MSHLRSLRFSLLSTLVGLLPLLALGCGETSTAYIRLSGPAPQLAGAGPAPVKLVVFWAAWCEPCRDETPALLRFARHPPAGIELHVLSQDQTLEAVSDFLEGPAPAEWRLRLDPQGQAYRAFRATGVPATFLVVRGRLVARFDGPRDWASSRMQRVLEQLIAEASGGPA